MQNDRRLLIIKYMYDILCATNCVISVYCSNT